MAARLNPRQADAARNAIKTTQLIRRLQAFALAENDPQTGKPVELSRARVAAILALLRKTLPDLQAVELSAAPGTSGGFVIFGQPEAATSKAWQQDNLPAG